MVDSISQYHKHISGSHQYIQKSNGTSHLGNRIIRNDMRNISHRLGTPHSQERTNHGPRIQERSIKQQIHENQKNAPIRLRTGPLRPGQLSDGSGIRTDIPVSVLCDRTRCDMEKEYGISITPIMVNGREIGHVYGTHTSRDVEQIFLLCHGRGMDVEEFKKPIDVSLKFVIPKGYLGKVVPFKLAERVAEGNVLYKKKDGQIYEAGEEKMLPNYLLSDNISNNDSLLTESPKKCAEFVRDMKNKGKPFNLLQINMFANNISLKDVIQGINDTFHRMPTLILACCRGESDFAETVSPSFRRHITGKERDPKFAPRLEKHIASDWTHKIHKLNNPFWRAFHKKEFK